MTRSQMRRAQKAKKKREAKYTLTQSQIDSMIKDAAKELMEDAKEDIVADTINTSMVLFLSFPLKVFVDKYWDDLGGDKMILEEFVEDILECYEKWQDGEYDLDELRNWLWEYAGVKLEEK